MGAGDTLKLWGLTLLFIPGVLGAQWAVWYPDNPVCAVRGSTVVTPCKYSYPEGYRVKTVMWCQNDEDCIDTQYVCHSDGANISAQYNGRAACLGDKGNSCTLKIRTIRQEDAGVYRFRFITTTQSGQWTERSGITLQVNELKVVMISYRENGTLREGDSVNLTCSTEICSVSQSEFTWYKNNQPIPETHSTLQFSSVSHTDSGSYSCALKGYRETESDQLLLGLESGSNLSFIFFIIGILLIVLIAILLMVIYVKRFVKRHTGLLKNEDENGIKPQITEEPEYATASDINISLTGNQRQEVSSQEEEVCYVDIQVKTKKPPKKSTVRDQENHDSTVIYSSVSK